MLGGELLCVAHVDVIQVPGIDQVLVPCLTPGDIVAMENFASHKGTGVREAIEAVGTELLYLPPYCPAFS